MSGIEGTLVKSAFSKYSLIGARRGATGDQAAKILMNNAGTSDVQTVTTNRFLSGHSNPSTKTLPSSEQVHGSQSPQSVLRVMKQNMWFMTIAVTYGWD